METRRTRYLVTLGVVLGLVVGLFLCAVTHAEAAKITLSWTDNSNNEAGFKIQRKAGTGGTYADLTTVGTDVAAYVDSSVVEGVTYCYHVNAYNSAGASAWSNEACAAAPFSVPAAPTQLTVTPGP